VTELVEIIIFFSLFLPFPDFYRHIWHLPGLLILRDGAISHNQPQIASNRIIHEKSHKIAQLQHNKQSINAFTGKICSYTPFGVDISFKKTLRKHLRLL